jgi:hypothetical protein
MVWVRYGYRRAECMAMNALLPPPLDATATNDDDGVWRRRSKPVESVTYVQS